MKLAVFGVHVATLLIDFPAALGLTALEDKIEIGDLVEITHKWWA